MIEACIKFTLKNKYNYNIYLIIIFIFLFMSALNYIFCYYDYKNNPNNSFYARMIILVSTNKINLLNNKDYFENYNCNEIDDVNNCYIKYIRKNEKKVIDYLEKNNINYNLIFENISFNKLKVRNILFMSIVFLEIILAYIYTTILNIINIKDSDNSKLLYYLGYSLYEIKLIRIGTIFIILSIVLLINLLFITIIHLSFKLFNPIFTIIPYFVLLFLNLLYNILKRQVILN